MRPQRANIPTGRGTLYHHKRTKQQGRAPLTGVAQTGRAAKWTGGAAPRVCSSIQKFSGEMSKGGLGS